MASMDFKIEHHLTLTTTEWRLVMKALTGTLKDEDKAPAMALQAQLMNQRAAHAKAWAKKINENLDD